LNISDHTIQKVALGRPGEHGGLRLVPAFFERPAGGQIAEPPVRIPEIKSVLEGRLVSNGDWHFASKLNGSGPNQGVIDLEKPHRQTDEGRAVGFRTRKLG